MFPVSLRHALLLCFVLGCCVNAANAQSAGSPDPAWPVISHPYTSPGLQGWLQILAQPSGKLLVNGTVPNGGDPYLALWRYRSDGQLDTSFGDGGERRLNLGRLTVDATGRIYNIGEIRTQRSVDGRTLNEFSVEITRLLVDGALDPSFGTGGVVTIPVRASYVQGSQADETWFEQQYSAPPNFFHGTVLLLPDGRILLLAMATEKSRPPAEVTLLGMRLLPNGAPDASFGPYGNGVKPLFRSDTGVSIVGPLVAQVDAWRDGSFTVAINQRVDLTSAAFILKYDVEGWADAGFGRNGSVHVPGATVDSIQLQSDGKLVVGGALNGQAVVARLNTDGSLDRAFGNNGSTVLADPVRSLALERSDAIIVVTSTAAESDTTPLALVRLTPDGDPDNSFVSTEIPEQRLDGEVVIAQGAYVLTANINENELAAEAIRRFLLHPEPRTGSLSTGQTPSMSGFRIDARDLPGNLVASVPTGQVLGLDGFIFPDGADLGAGADIFVVAASPQGMYMRNSAGDFVRWNGRVADLVPALEDVQLTSKVHVPVYAGRLPFAGTYQLYLGYMRSAGGPLIYSAEPATLDIMQ